MMDEGLEALAEAAQPDERQPRRSLLCVQERRDWPPRLGRTRFRCSSADTASRLVERAARLGQGWLPGWRPLAELKERIEPCDAVPKSSAAIRSPSRSHRNSPFTIAKTMEEAERIYMESGLVAHRKSLAYTGRDLSQQVVANLVGSPDVILEKIAYLKSIGVDHCCALMIPANSMSEFIEQIEWFAADVMKPFAV